MAFWRRHGDGDPEQSRMTLGEHLEELRGCVARSLIVLVAACLLCIWPSKYLLQLIARPAVIALRRHDQPDSFLAIEPVEALVVYIKVVLIFGLIISAPYILYQLWSFVAKGLYRREREWVHRLVPTSVGLFLAGVVFMYLFALVLSLNFLVGFSNWLPLPSPKPTALDRLLLHIPETTLPASQPSIAEAPRIPLLQEDPCNPPVGSVWIDMPGGNLKVRWPNETFSVQLQRADRRAMVTSHFRIGDYLSFVLVLTIAFGLAFQMPLVVVFLARTGIVPVPTLRKYRKVVVVVVVFIAGTLAPPDLLSHLTLTAPMLLLFEIGLFFAARGEKKAAEGGRHLKG
jgi:sec-independent protein translocase protein TatC